MWSCGTHIDRKIASQGGTLTSWRGDWSRHEPARDTYFLQRVEDGMAVPSNMYRTLSVSQAASTTHERMMEHTAWFASSSSTSLRKTSPAVSQSPRAYDTKTALSALVGLGMLTSAATAAKCPSALSICPNWMYTLPSMGRSLALVLLVVDCPCR